MVCLGGKREVIERRGKESIGATLKVPGKRHTVSEDLRATPNRPAKEGQDPTQPGGALGSASLPPSLAKVDMRQPWAGLHHTLMFPRPGASEG